MSFNSGYIVSTFLMEVLTIAKEKDLLINNEIRCGSMLVIGPKGEQLGVKSRSDALTLADYAGFDLVLINENANPPVCKLMDYKKYKYEKKLANFPLLKLVSFLYLFLNLRRYVEK